MQAYTFLDLLTGMTKKTVHKNHPLVQLPPAFNTVGQLMKRPICTAEEYEC